MQAFIIAAKTPDFIFFNFCISIIFVVFNNSWGSSPLSLISLKFENLWVMWVKNTLLFFVIDLPTSEEAFKVFLRKIIAIKNESKAKSGFEASF